MLESSFQNLCDKASDHLEEIMPLILLIPWAFLFN
jgi:hypothetical protein